MRQLKKNDIFYIKLQKTKIKILQNNTLQTKNTFIIYKKKTTYYPSLSNRLSYVKTK